MSLGAWPFTALLLASALTQAASAQTRPRVPSEPAGLLSTLDPSDSPSSPAQLLKLGARRDPRAARRLLEWSRDPQVIESSRLSLALVRALHAHARGPFSEEITRALLALLRAERPPFRTDAGPGRLRVRETAALALSHIAHTEALRVLLADATTHEPLDPEARRIARLALEAHPPSAEAIRALPHFPPELSSAFLEERARPPHPARSATRALEAAQPSEIRALSRPEEGVDFLERALAAAELRTSAITTERAWRAEFEKQPQPSHLSSAWALRSLTWLSLEHPELLELTLRRARIGLRSASPLERASAAFALAVHAPEEALELLEHPDPILRFAALRAARTEKQLERVLAVERGHELSSDTLHLPLALAHPALWPRLSLAHLRDEEGRWPHLPLAVSALSARVRGEQRKEEGAPPEEIAAGLASSSAEHRAATAFGLGESSFDGSLGWIWSAYERENDVVVRRALVFALAKKSGPTAQKLLWIPSVLEPDPSARARARLVWQERAGISAPPSNGTREIPARVRDFTWSWSPVPPTDGDEPTSPQLKMIQSIEGQPWPVVPDPDGYVSVFGALFVRP